MNKDIIKQYSCELIGTFFLTLAVLVTSNPLAVGIMLAGLVYIGTFISGGHYNPAVTLSLWLNGRFSLHHVPGYMLAQLCGAWGAGALSYYLLGKIVFTAPLVSLGTLKPMMLEMLGCFVFVSVVLEATSTERADATINALMIGLALASVAFLWGAYSGGAFNPAVGIGPVLFDMAKGGSSGWLIPIYCMGPFAGALVASIFHGWWRGKVL